MSGLKSKRKAKWRVCNGYPAYEVSEYGDVRRVAIAKTRPAPGYFLKGCYNRDGYRCYKLMTPEGSKLTMKAHVLVARAFLGARPLGRHAAHIDGDCTNNHYTNLYWATPQENCGSDRKKHGRAPVGIKNPRAVLSEEQVREIRQKSAKDFPHSELAREYKVSHGCIQSIVHKRTWRHVRP